MKKNAVPAFTLIELVIAMILGTLLVLTFYWLITFATKQYTIFKEKQDALQTLVLFKEVLSNDIDACDYIITNSEVDFFFVYPDDTTSYQIGEKIIINKFGETDTFDIVLEVYNPDYIKLIRGTEIVKTINFTMRQPLEIENISFSKNYSSSQLMNIPE